MDYLKSIFSTAFLTHFILQIVQGFELVYLQNASPRTCIVGAGYSGLATAKHLKDYNMDFTIFEVSKYVGGVWHFDPRVGVDEDGIPIFAKMYKGLRSLSPNQFSEFFDYPFSEGTSSFVSSECIHKYLSSFANKFEILQHIQFRRLVTSVKRFKTHWQLTYYRGDTRDTVSETCDYVVIATGLYNDPVWPQIKGANTFKGTISHSSTYRGDTEVYRNRSVLIVGAGASGLDLASKISKVASKLIHSHHNVMNLPIHEESYVKKPDIQFFTYNGVIFNDGTYEEVDDVIYCTGYLNWRPYLDDSSLTNGNGKVILPLYRKIVNIKHPTMLFVGASKATIQKILDVQGNYAASLIAGRFQLPSEDEMMKSWIDEVNRVQNIEEINVMNEKLSYYCGNLSQEAGTPALPPVFDSMRELNGAVRRLDFIHSLDYEWHIIDDHNFDRVYVGPIESKCSIN